MSVRLRLRRQGRKGHPYYHIVAADARVSRDGKFLEKVGTYNPTANPAVIEVDHDKAIKWLKNGAQPTNTVKAILRYTGVNLKYALIKQGKSPEEQDRIFTRWMNEKIAKIEAKKDRISEEKARALNKALAHEAEVKAAKEAAIVAKNTPPQDEPAAEPVAEAEAPAAEEGGETAGE
jgi:small subunit ribosomal protein S16